ncbi:histidine kinase [Nonomuraea sp. NPDC049141]|uniref:sensor histidine kinase n=1 Tax=Nonomuraea sp. NPDC049141 TaxID=3155500 RepID=UPI0033DC74A3
MRVWAVSAGRLRAWAVRHPEMADAGLACLVAALAIPATAGGADARGVLEPGTGVTGAAWLWFAVVHVPLVWRRRAPAVVFWIVLGLVGVSGLIGVTGVFLVFVPLLAVYTVARHRPQRHLWPAVGAVAGAVGLSGLRDDPGWPTLIGMSSVLVVVALLGVTLRMRQGYLAERARHLAEQRDHQARLAVAAERARIAREVHDIVAHSLAVMVALADGASYTARASLAYRAPGTGGIQYAAGAAFTDGASPAEGGSCSGGGSPVDGASPIDGASPTARDSRADSASHSAGASHIDTPLHVDTPLHIDRASYFAGVGDERVAVMMEKVSETGRQALSEMRRLVGLLRDGGGESRLGGGSDRAPQPGLDDLDRLVDQVREAGVRVEVLREGVAGNWGPGAGLAVYRIVQEALTNVLKHAGRRASVRVQLSYTTYGADLEITDDGAGRHARPVSVRPDGGRGLVGPDGAHGLAGSDGKDGLAGPGGLHGLAGPDDGGGLVGPDGGPSWARPDGGYGTAGPSGGHGLVGSGGGYGTPGAEGGHGLAGMVERAASYGGWVEAGPIPGGGWRVRVRLRFDDNMLA